MLNSKLVSLVLGLFAVDPATAAAKAQYAGQTYYYCSDTCHKTFSTEPQRYTGGVTHGGAHRSDDR